MQQYRINEYYKPAKADLAALKRLSEAFRFRHLEADDEEVHPAVGVITRVVEGLKELTGVLSAASTPAIEDEVATASTSIDDLVSQLVEIGNALGGDLDVASDDDDDDIGDDDEDGPPVAISGKKESGQRMRAPNCLGDYGDLLGGSSGGQMREKLSAAPRCLA